MNVYIFDACVLLALLRQEDGADKVRALLKQAHAGAVTISMNVINLLEVYYDRLREEGAEKTDEIMRIISFLPIHIIDHITTPILHEAGRLKVAYKRISLADCIAVATAVSVSGTLVTCDHKELDAVEAKEQLPFLWIR
jgi:predicted nucleic acid-binding protein